MKKFFTFFWLVSLIGLTGLLLAFPKTAAAHPLDEYLQASYITLSPDSALIEINLSPGLLIVPPVLALIDTDHNQQISEAEGQAYARLMLQDVSLTVDGTLRQVTLTKASFPSYLDLSSGLVTIKLEATAPLPTGPTNNHALVLHNQHAPAKSVYQVNPFIGPDSTKLGQFKRDETQQTLTLEYTVNAAAATTSTMPAATAAPSATTTTPQSQQLLGYVYEPDLSPWLWIVALGLAMLLGGLHALTPGHGKTLVAAYLVGSRGTAGHAILLGGIITFTHTISVIVIGLLALFASSLIVPSALVPSLEIIAGLLVVGLGARLLWTRWASNRAHAHPRSHTAIPADRIRLTDLLAMGISGGLVPCPEALGILVIAVGLNRIGLGLSLIVAFSLGIAIVLIAIGLLLVRFRAIVNKFDQRGRRWQRWLPLVSAAAITLLGLGIAVKGLTSSPAGYQPIIAVVVLILVVVWALAAYLLWRKRPQPAKTKALSNAPMASAPMRYDDNGQVAWDEMWTDFCALALDGGPPHRGTMLEPVGQSGPQADPAKYQAVSDEIARGLRQITGFETLQNARPGWIGLVCPDEDMATWMANAIKVENVTVERDGKVLFLPVGPDFRVEKEIKNVITVVAKTHHYWTEHLIYS